MEPGADAVGETEGAAVHSRQSRIATALLALVLLAAVGYAAFDLWSRRQAVEQHAVEHSTGIARLLAGQLSLEVDAVAAALEQLADYSRRNGGPSSSGESWIQFLAVARSGQPAVESLSVTDATGDVTFGWPTESMGSDYSGSDLFARLSADPMNNALAVGAPTRSQIDGRWVLPLGRVNRAPSGTLDGILVATLAPSRLADFYRSTDAAGQDGIVWVLSPVGEVLLREPSRGNPTQEPWPSLPLDPAQPPAANSGVVTAPIEAGGEPYLTAYVTSPQAGLTVAVSRPQSAILGGWRHEMHKGVVTVVVLALLLVAANLGFRRALRPKV